MRPLPSRRPSTALGELVCVVVFSAIASGCFGQPEDQFVLEGTAYGADGGVWPFAKVKLERDQGATEESCSAFADFTSVTADESGHWSLDLIRQQTRGRLSDHRCFRASVSHPDGRRSAVVFPFTGDDVHAPPLRLWPDRQSVGPSSAGLFFFTLPDSFRLPGEGAAALNYRAELTNGHGRVWRQSCGGGSASRLFCDVERRARLGTQFPIIRAAAVQNSATYGRDPFGQLKVTAFEQRIETRPITINTFGLDLPFTLGAECDVANKAGACALTDGDARPQKLPLGTFQVEMDFGAPIRVAPFSNHEVYVHGIWVDGPWTRIVLEAQLQDTDTFVQVGLFSVDKDERSRIQVSREDPLPALDLGPIFLQPTENSEVLGYRKLRLHAVNEKQTVPLTALGEVAVY